MSQQRGIKRPSRRLCIAALLVVALVAGIIAAIRSQYNSPVRAAKRYFVNSISSDTGQEKESAGISSAIAVQALTELLEENTSASSGRYDRIYQRSPRWLQELLPKPVDRKSIAVTAVQLLGQFGSNAAPAVARLTQLLPSNGRDQMMLRVSAVDALGQIGPAARRAVPGLLLQLQPGSRALANVAIALEEIDPTGDLADRAWQELLAQRSHALWASNLATHCIQSLRAPRVDERLSTGFHTRMLRLPGERGLALQILGSMRFAASTTAPEIIAYLGDRNPRAREAAAMTLLRLGPAATNALPKLRSLFDDESELVRLAVTNAVRAIER